MPPLCLTAPRHHSVDKRHCTSSSPFALEPAGQGGPDGPGGRRGGAAGGRRARRDPHLPLRLPHAGRPRGGVQGGGLGGAQGAVGVLPTCACASSACLSWLAPRGNFHKPPNALQVNERMLCSVVEAAEVLDGSSSLQHVFCMVRDCPLLRCAACGAAGMPSNAPAMLIFHTLPTMPCFCAPNLCRREASGMARQVCCCGPGHTDALSSNEGPASLSRRLFHNRPKLLWPHVCSVAAPVHASEDAAPRGRPPRWSWGARWGQGAT